MISKKDFVSVGLSFEKGDNILNTDLNYNEYISELIANMSKSFEHSELILSYPVNVGEKTKTLFSNIQFYACNAAHDGQIDNVSVKVVHLNKPVKSYVLRNTIWQNAIGDKLISLSVNSLDCISFIANAIPTLYKIQEDVVYLIDSHSHTLAYKELNNRNLEIHEQAVGYIIDRTSLNAVTASVDDVYDIIVQLSQLMPHTAYVHINLFHDSLNINSSYSMLNEDENREIFVVTSNATTFPAELRKSTGKYAIMIIIAFTSMISSLCLSMAFTTILDNIFSGLLFVSSLIAITSYSICAYNYISNKQLYQTILMQHSLGRSNNKITTGLYNVQTLK